MKRLFTTLSQKWPEYLLEILVLIVGIYGAFSLEEWAEDRSIEKKELELLSGMLVDLERDLQDNSYNIKWNRGAIIAHENVLGYLKNTQPIDDSAFYFFGNLYGAVHFVANTSSFESLQAFGLDRVKNKELRDQISAHYSWYINHVQYLETHDDHKLQYDALFPQIMEKLEHYEHLDNEKVLSFNARPVDENQLKQDHVFANSLLFNKTMKAYMLSVYEEQRSRIKKLMDAIETELTTRN